MIADQDVYGNKVKVFAKEILKGHIDSTSTYSDGSGSIGSESRPIIIKKIDSKTKEPLIGAVFTLQKTPSTRRSMD